ncbi:MAG: sulfurtransferase, partial [Alphaproteobacteria bacterium]
MTHPLVSTEWLAAHLKAPDIRIVDASWHMPATGRNARSEHAQSHIPGAVFFDI